MFSAHRGPEAFAGVPGRAPSSIPSKRTADPPSCPLPLPCFLPLVPLSRTNEGPSDTVFSSASRYFTHSFPPLYPLSFVFASAWRTRSWRPGSRHPFYPEIFSDQQRMERTVSTTSLSQFRHGYHAPLAETSRLPQELSCCHHRNSAADVGFK